MLQDTLSSSLALVRPSDFDRKRAETVCVLRRCGWTERGHRRVGPTFRVCLQNRASMDRAFTRPCYGTIIAIFTAMMIDVALSIFALIASGLTLELFAGSSSTDKDAELTPQKLSFEEVLIGNPS